MIRTSPLKSTLLALSLGSLLFGLSACGDSDDDDDTAAGVKSGELKASLLDSTTVTSYDFTSTSCNLSADTGLFTGSFGGASGVHMDVKVKGFTTTGGTWTCTQSPDNVDGDAGLKYNGCMVEFTVPDASTKLNTYDMHRTVDSVQAFTYNKSCTVVATYAAPKVSLTVSCAGMIQTIYQGAARNPIEPTVTGTVATGTNVSCNIQ